MMNRKGSEERDGMKGSAMKKSMILMFMMGMGILFSGCDKVQAIKDALSDPEDIVADYVLHITDIMNSSAQCDELQAKLEAYCSAREAAVTKAVTETAARVKRNEITEEKQRALEEKFKEIGDVNFTSCLMTPGVNFAKLNCLKPVKGLL